MDAGPRTVKSHLQCHDRVWTAKVGREDLPEINTAIQSHQVIFLPPE